jgi:protein phosphatase
VNQDVVGWDEAHSLWFVADGMGGHASGDVASRVVKDALLTAGALPLGQALQRAHAAVVTAAAANPAYGNMGSTVIAIRIGQGKAEVAWVGDSRAYLWDGRSLTGITRDHSFLELLREQELITDAQLRHHPQRNLVTQTLGIGTPEPSVRTVPLHQHDWLLLCSDGLTDELEDVEIASILRRHTDPDTAADALIASTLAHGGKDNVSVVIVEYDGPETLGTATRTARTFSGAAKFWFAAAAGTLLALLLAVQWLGGWE